MRLHITRHVIQRLMQRTNSSFNDAERYLDESFANIIRSNEGIYRINYIADNVPHNSTHLVRLDDGFIVIRVLENQIDLITYITEEQVHSSIRNRFYLIEPVDATDLIRWLISSNHYIFFLCTLAHKHFSTKHLKIVYAKINSQTDPTLIPSHFPFIKVIYYLINILQQNLIKGGYHGNDTYNSTSKSNRKRSFV